MSHAALDIIADSIDYITAHWEARPDLDTLARRAGYAPAQFQKLFTQSTGVSPHKMLRYCGYRHARQFLLEGHSTLDSAYQAGLSGNGRLHALFLQVEAATPGEVKARGAGLSICYGWHLSPFGAMLIGETDKGVCWLGFAYNGNDQAHTEKRMRDWWPKATFIEEIEVTQKTAEKIIQLCSAPLSSRGPDTSLKLNLYGTNFQMQVWQALLRIPAGHTVSYQAIGRAMGKDKASRAVGGAVGANPVSLLIPCHRVIQASGLVENYGWGSAKKKLLLGIESDPGERLINRPSHIL